MARTNLMLFEGENGARFEIDPDSLPAPQRARHDAAVEAGRLVVVPVVEVKRTSKPLPPKPAPVEKV